MQAKMLNVVVVDDDELNLMIVQRLLRNVEVQLTCFADELEAQGYLTSHAVDVLIADQRMPKLDGLDLLKSLGDARPRRSYLCSGIALPQELQAQAQALGVKVISKETLTYREPLLDLLRGNET